MKIKKPVLKVIQIGTLFVFTSLSFLGIISFSSPEISSFWNVKKINFSISTPVFADQDEEEDDDKNYSKKYKKEDNENKNKNKEEEDDDDNNNDKKTSTITTNNNTSNTSSTTSNTSGTSNNTNNSNTSTSTNTTTPTCRNVITTIYDTVTSASGITSQVPRQVTNQVCDTATTNQNQANNATTNNNSTTNQNQANNATINQNQTANNTATINNIYNDGTYSGVGKYSYVGGSVDYSVEIVILGGKIASAKFLNFTASGNGKYTQIQGEAILAKIVSTQNSTIDTVSGASGTSKAIQDSVDNALSKAKIKQVNNPITNSGITNTEDILNKLFSSGLNDIEKASVSIGIDDKLYIYTKEEKIKKINLLLLQEEKIIKNFEILKSKSTDEDYIMSLENKINIHQDIKDILSGKKTKLQNDLILLKKTQDLKVKNITKISFYKALNGKTYTIIDDGVKVMIKKSDGSYAKQSFKTYNEAVAYLNKNAVLPKKVVIQAKKAIVTKNPTKTVTSTPAKTVTKTVTPTKVVNKPVVDTTTKAS
ncbi:MAG: FMN-binding protein [Candidatus Gracilibacteria bacterium]|nr:FMN-binding protein [Candidatus Gracilibacteria bacterium]